MVENSLYLHFREYKLNITKNWFNFFNPYDQLCQTLISQTFPVSEWVGEWMIEWVNEWVGK